jgi:hypothetical protein
MLADSGVDFSASYREFLNREGVITRLQVDEAATPIAGHLIHDSQPMNLNPAVGWGCPPCEVGWDYLGLRFRRG